MSRCEGDLGDLPAERVEAGDDDRLRGVVHDEVDAGRHLERADVAPLAADDPALHVVRRQVHDRHGGLHRVVGREPLDGRREDLARLALGALARLLLEPHRDQGGLAAGVLLHLGEEPLLGLLGGEARDPLEVPALLVDQRVLLGLDLLQPLLARAETLLAGVVVAVPAVELVEPPRDLLLLLAQAALERLHLLLALAGLLLELGPGAEHDLLGLDRGVLEARLRVTLGLVEQPAAVLRNIAKPSGRQLSLDQQSAESCQGQQHDERDDQDDERGGLQDGHLPRAPADRRGFGWRGVTLSIVINPA